MKKALCDICGSDVPDNAAYIFCRIEPWGLNLTVRNMTSGHSEIPDLCWPCVKKLLLKCVEQGQRFDEEVGELKFKETT